MKNSSDSERAIHGFAQVSWYRPTSVFAHLNCLFEEQTAVRTKVIDVCTCVSLPVMRWGLQAGPLLANGTRSTCNSIYIYIYTFYTNARILILAMMFYDAKPQLVKTPVAA